MTKDLEQFKKLWNFHRGHTLDLLKTLSDEELGFSVGQNMGTLGQQFCHLCRVDDQYISAIETLRVENNRKKLEFPLETSVSKLTEQLEGDGRKLFQIIKDMSEESVENIKIDWTYWKEKELGLLEHLNNMLEHEILHHGQLIVYFRIMNKKFPESWSAWGI